MALSQPVLASKSNPELHRIPGEIILLSKMSTTWLFGVTNREVSSPTETHPGTKASTVPLPVQKRVDSMSWQAGVCGTCTNNTCPWQMVKCNTKLTEKRPTHYLDHSHWLPTSSLHIEQRPSRGQWLSGGGGGKNRVFRRFAQNDYFFPLNIKYIICKYILFSTLNPEISFLMVIFRLSNKIQPAQRSLNKYAHVIKLSTVKPEAKGTQHRVSPWV